MNGGAPDDPDGPDPSDTGEPDPPTVRAAALLGSDVRDTGELDGGQVGTVHRVELVDGRVVVAKTGPAPLSIEAAMLRHLGRESDLPVPDVLHAEDDLLVIEYVENDGRVTPAVERDAADHLAALHAETAGAFGFERDTLTGPLRQPNPWTDSWVAFFREHRLSSMADEAAANGPLPASLRERVADVAADCDDLLTEPETPSLLHGDVWRTNVLVRDGTVAAFVDPACYYGHPEVELAYVDWLDTFGRAFFERYRERRGVDPGFDRRKLVYALYPQLTHARLFGGHYVDVVDRTLSSLGY
ncbi:fructosamine kinase family protein [Halobium salinum]|uniref:Fructosamine kinase family protein n=1 Tax=Halobium salinum TaxID=1364940 RepID=A0ABD5P974_9EURY|nr:fructosamine kinase family protein [Halobium salinum]